MSSVTHIVKVFIDHQWDHWTPDAEWVERRLDLFRRTTLNSLCGQTFKDFRVWLICGEKNKELTSRQSWAGCGVDVRPIYDMGKADLETIDTPFLAVTRIDSDDLMREDTMAELAEAVRVRNPDLMGYFVWRKALCWDRLNAFIGYHYREAPPFVCQLFPKAWYEEWPVFSLVNYQEHGRLGGRKPEAVEMPSHRICVVKHSFNASDGQRDRKPTLYSRDTIAEWEASGHILTSNAERIAKELIPFGVTSQMIGTP